MGRNAEYVGCSWHDCFRGKGGAAATTRFPAHSIGTLERLTARLGVLHGRLETAQAIGHFGTVNTVKRDMKRAWTERERVLDRLLNQVVHQGLV